MRLRFVAESSIDTPGLRRGEVDLEANANRPSAPDIRAEKMGEAGRERVADLSWDPVVARLTAP